MEDEILKIMAAEIAGENVTKEEREKMNRWWEEKRGNERTYKMLMGELGAVSYTHLTLPTSLQV